MHNVQGWISVKERLPGKDQVDGLNPRVTVDLFLFDGHRPFAGYYSFERKSFYEYGYSDYNEDVTHWITPAPPTEGKVVSEGLIDNGDGD